MQAACRLRLPFALASKGSLATSLPELAEDPSHTAADDVNRAEPPKRYPERRFPREVAVPARQRFACGSREYPGPGENCRFGSRFDGGRHVTHSTVR